MKIWAKLSCRRSCTTLGTADIGQILLKRGVALALGLTFAASTALAIPYASAVKRTGDTVNFILNQAAASVEVLRDGANPVSLGTEPGLQTFSMAGFTKFEIIVTGNEAPGWKQYVPDGTNTSFYVPLGVSINKHPSSPNFGKVFISEAQGGRVAVGYRTTTSGIYMLNADGSDAGWANGGVDWSSVPGTPLFKSTIGPDDHLYVADLSRDLAFEFNDDLSVATQLIDESNRIGLQYVHGIYVEGTRAGGDRRLYLVNGNYNDLTGKGLIRYDLGAEATVAPYDTGTPILTAAYYSYYPYDVARDSNGDWYLSQYRANPSQAPVITKFNGAGEVPLDDDVIWEASDQYTYPYGIDINELTGRVAYGHFNTGEVFFFDMATGQFVESFDAGNRIRELAFDAAGNLVTLDNSIQWARFWSPGGFTVATTSFDGTQSAFTVIKVNQGPPLIGALADARVAELTTLEALGTASDPDGPDQKLSWSLVAGPEGAAVDTVSGRITWTPTEAQGPGVYTLAIRVTDNGVPPLSDEGSFTVTVEEVNLPPALAVEDATINEGLLVDLALLSNDSDLPAQTLTYALISGPASAAVDSETGRFRWQTTEADGGQVFPVVVSATDNGEPPLNTIATFNIAVKEANSAPVLLAIPDASCDEHQELVLVASASDPDLPPQALQFSLVDGPPGAEMDPATGEFRWTPSEAQGPGVFQVAVRVADDGEQPLGAEQTFHVAVAEVDNGHPTFAALGEPTVNEGETLRIGSLIVDPDIPPSVVTFIVVQAPEGMEYDASGASLVWTPTEAQGGNSFPVTLKLVEEGSPPCEAETSFAVVVRELNDPPVLADNDDRVVSEWEDVSFTITATDTDLPPQNLIFSLVNPTAGATIDPRTGEVQWTPTEAQGPGNHTFTVRVTDSGAPPLSAENSFTVMVSEVNAAPVLDAVLDQGVPSGELLEVQLVAYDPDLPANTLVYALVSGSPEAVVEGSILRWQTSAADLGSVVPFEVKATDDGNPPMSDAAQFTVTVLPPLVKAPFTKVTGGPVVSDGGDSIGVAWGDYDGDGWQDLFVANNNMQTNFLYHNERDGTFVRIADAGPVLTVATHTAGAWGDYDNDGRLDLFVAQWDTTNALYCRDWTGGFISVTGSSIVSDVGYFHGAAWADYDNDGNLDLAVCDTKGRCSLYRNSGDGSFSRIVSGAMPNEVGTLITPSWGDFDADGDLDLFVAVGGEHTNRNLLFRNDDSHFTKITGGPVTTDMGSSQAGSWADYDNDGDLDLLVTSPGETLRLYQNEGNGIFSGPVPNAFEGDSVHAASSAWGDFDNDGFVDLFLATADDTSNVLYRNSGNGTFTRWTQGSMVNDRGHSWSCAWADYDNDGFLDLVVGNRHEENFLYRNRGNENHWLKVRLMGTRSNASAIGAKILVKAQVYGQDLWQLREVSGGTGFCAQNALDAHFGLGDGETAGALRIQWPSGIAQEFENLAANQFLTITEPPVLMPLDILPGGGFEMILTSRGGFDYAIEATEDFTQWMRIGTLTRVNGSVQFVDTMAAEHPRRFYRAVMVP